MPARNVTPHLVIPCACANLRRAARAVTRAYEAALSGVDITPTRLVIFQVLSQFKEPVRQGEIGTILGLDKTTLTRSLQPLAEQDLVESSRGGDNRETRWALTRGGRLQLRIATGVWEDTQERLRAKIGRERWDRLAADLAVVSAAADEIAPELKAEALL